MKITVNISKTNHKALQQLKLDGEYKTIDEVITTLIHTYKTNKEAA